MAFRILIADLIHEEAQHLLASRPGCEVVVATGLSEPELIERIGDFDGIIVRSRTQVTAPVIAAGARLKAIGRAGNVPRISAEQLGRTRPYRQLAYALGRAIAALVPEPITAFELGLLGRAAELDPRPITSEALVGLLEKRFAVPVNHVNAMQLAHRQGINVRETRTEESHEYISLVELRATSQLGTTSVAGTLLGESRPRLVRIDEL